ncbi:MAG: type II toxin-antitoxin system VapC family toxin [Propionibacteriaceae bacterium]|jgi:predicted nucleic acid-binding protein|nr:type II toxin-antitoxin system VapC family toxin [Propionibacteriaceae bacterium]
MSKRVLIDTAIPLFAVGGAAAERAECQQVLQQIAENQLDAYASVEMIQEAVFHRMRVGERAAAVQFGRDLAELITILDFDKKVLTKALELMETCSIRGRDAVHAATAFVNGIDTIISTDPAYATVPGLALAHPTAFID